MLELYFKYLAPIALSFGLAIGVYSYRRLSPTHRIIVLFLLVSLLVDITSRILAEYGLLNHNMFIVMAILEIGIFSLLYAQLLKQKTFPLIVLGLGLSYSLYELIVYQTIELKTFQSYAKPVADFFVAGLSGYALFRQMQNPEKQRDVLFHVVIFSYFSFELLVLLPFNYLINQQSSLVMYIWYGRIVVAFSFYLYLARVLWKNGKTPTRLHSGSYSQ